jgi:hypothetical protein
LLFGCIINTVAKIVVLSDRYNRWILQLIIEIAKPKSRAHFSFIASFIIFD